MGRKVTKSKEIIMFSPEYWWEENKGKNLRGDKREIERWGGMGKVVANVCERLPAYGYHISVLARKKGNIYPYPENYYNKKILFITGQLKEWMCGVFLLVEIWV